MSEDFSLDAFTSDKQIDSERLIKTCKYRQGEQCCKYIYFPRTKGDFYCVKNIPELKIKLDSIATEMAAKGDNCLGL